MKVMNVKIDCNMNYPQWIFILFMGLGVKENRHKSSDKPIVVETIIESMG
jgi:hypothetical protein